MSANELVTEFLLAAEQGNVDAKKPALEKGVDINAATIRKEPPLLLPA